MLEFVCMCTRVCWLEGDDGNEILLVVAAEFSRFGGRSDASGQVYLSARSLQEDTQLAAMCLNTL